MVRCGTGTNQATLTGAAVKYWNYETNSMANVYVGDTGSPAGTTCGTTRL
jgi:hypothetical protein